MPCFCLALLFDEIHDFLGNLSTKFAILLTKFAIFLHNWWINLICFLPRVVENCTFFFSNCLKKIGIYFWDLWWNSWYFLTIVWKNLWLFSATNSWINFAKIRKRKKKSDFHENLKFFTEESHACERIQVSGSGEYCTVFFKCRTFLFCARFGQTCTLFQTTLLKENLSWEREFVM